MSVLDRSELEASPLADLHAIADQLGLDGFRRLRKAELIGAGGRRGRTPAPGPAAPPSRSPAAARPPGPGVKGLANPWRAMAAGESAAYVRDD